MTGVVYDQWKATEPSNGDLRDRWEWCAEVDDYICTQCGKPERVDGEGCEWCEQ